MWSSWRWCSAKMAAQMAGSCWAMVLLRWYMAILLDEIPRHAGAAQANGYRGAPRAFGTRAVRFPVVGRPRLPRSTSVPAENSRDLSPVAHGSEFSRAPRAPCTVPDQDASLAAGGSGPAGASGGALPVATRCRRAYSAITLSA